MPSEVSMRQRDQATRQRGDVSSSSVRPMMDADVAFRVVQVEALLRQGAQYIEKTRSFVQRGEAPPVELDEHVQQKALVQSGLSADVDTIESYRARVRCLPRMRRSLVFFLEANDRFFHPELGVPGSVLQGLLVDRRRQSVDIQASWLAQARAANCKQLFVLASTST